MPVTNLVYTLVLCAVHYTFTACQSVGCSHDSSGVYKIKMNQPYFGLFGIIKIEIIYIFTGGRQNSCGVLYPTKNQNKTPKKRKKLAQNLNSVRVTFCHRHRNCVSLKMKWKHLFGASIQFFAQPVAIVAHAYLDIYATVSDFFSSAGSSVCFSMLRLLLHIYVYWRSFIYISVA